MSTSTTRRQFLQAAMATPAGALLSPAAFSLSQAPPARPVNLFTKCLQFLDYDRMAETLARTGFDGADLPLRPGGSVLPERVKTDLPRAVAALRKQGRSVPMIVTAINNPDDPRTEQILGTAAHQGIKYYRMGYFDYDPALSLPRNLDKHRQTLEKLENLNRRHGIHGGYQNHAGTKVGGPVWDLHLLLQDRDPAFVGLQYDICHAVTEGGTSWPLGLKLLAPWIKTIAVKDFRWQQLKGKWQPEYVPLGQGMVDFDAYLKNYKNLGLSGPLTLHAEYDLGGAEHARLQPTMGPEQIAGKLQQDLGWLRARLRQHGLS
ncbi:MAG: sugar phosphate isomerase/epimerase family protein [Adhaeribacter sp.]